MKQLIGVIAIALLTGSISIAGAAIPAAEVEGVQLPAWLVRGDQRQALALGQALRKGDEIASGSGARILLRLGDGSVVKLGENSRFQIEELARAPKPTGVFATSLSVLQGAFRFTTEAVYRFRGQREVKVRFATVTAGIRGTDLWGKSAPDKDIVCLIEGKIAVSRAGDEPITMQDPLTFYVAPKNEAPLPIAAVSSEQLGKWAVETEIGSGMGALRKGGQWKVYVASSPDKAGAQAVMQQLREAGVPVEMNALANEGSTTYWVRLVGLPSFAEARALAARLKGAHGIFETSVSTR